MIDFIEGISYGERLKLKYKDRIDNILSKGRSQQLDKLYIYKKYFHEAYSLADEGINGIEVLKGEELDDIQKFKLLTISFEKALEVAEKEICK